MTSKKYKAFWGASFFGFAAFVILALRMDQDQLVTLTQFYFGYEGLVSAGFFGFNFGEHWTKTKNGNPK